MSLISGLNSLSLNDLLSQQGLIQPNQISGLVADYNPQSLTTQATPGQIGNLVGWWRADQGVNLTGGKVSSWNDLSGNGNTLTQGTSANQPTFTSSNSTFNHQSTVNFLSTGPSYMFNNNVNVSQPNTIFIVFTTDGTSTSQFAIDASTPSGDPHRQVIYNNAGGGTVAMYAGSTVGQNGLTDTAPLSTIAVFNGASSGLYTNSNAPVQASTPGTQDLKGIIVGSAFNITAGLNGSIAEVAVFSSALTQSQASQLSLYCAQRYGITVSIGSITPSFTNDGDSHKVVTQSTFSFMPTLNISDASYNNQPSLSFSRNNTSFMKSGTWTTSVPQPLTAIVVGNDDGTSTQSLFFDNEGLPSEVAIVSATSGSAFYQLFAASFAATSVPTSSTPKVIVGVFNGASSSAFINGRTNVLGGNNPGTATKTGITLGSTYTPGFFLNGKLVRILIYNRALLQSEINSLLQYCGVSYEIQIGN